MMKYTEVNYVAHIYSYNYGNIYYHIQIYNASKRNESEKYFFFNL